MRARSTGPWRISRYQRRKLTGPKSRHQIDGKLICWLFLGLSYSSENVVSYDFVLFLLFWGGGFAVFCGVRANKPHFDVPVSFYP